jgi:peptidoglycan-associated lipoprotein
VLGLQGVGDSRLSTVSYGEERPAVAGEDESAYARNRRVELIYVAGG